MHPEVSRQERVREGLRASARLLLPYHQAVEAGADLNRSAMDEPSGFHSFHTWAVYAEYRFAPVRWFGLSAGVRYDGSEVAAGEVNPSADLRLSPWQGGVLSARWSRTTRWPSLGEIPPSAGVKGEVLSGASIGFRQRLFGGRITLGASWFYLWLERELVIDETTGAYRNDTGRTFSRGLELEVSAQVVSGLSLFGAYTLNHLRREGDPEPVAYGPAPQIGAVGAFLRRGPYTARASLRYLGPKRGVYRHLGEPTEVADSVVADLYAARDVGAGFAVFVNAGNLFNVRYETFQGRPMFGRTILAGLQIRTF
jgi:outer membrane receptor protein involved in Fe transport